MIIIILLLLFTFWLFVILIHLWWVGVYVELFYTYIDFLRLWPPRLVDHFLEGIFWHRYVLNAIHREYFTIAVLFLGSIFIIWIFCYWWKYYGGSNFSYNINIDVFFFILFLFLFYIFFYLFAYYAFVFRILL